METERCLFHGAPGFPPPTSQPSQRRRCRPTRTAQRRRLPIEAGDSPVDSWEERTSKAPTPEINFSLTEALIIRRLGIAGAVKLIKVL